MKKIFSRELEAYYDMNCDECGDLILKGDPFFFCEGGHWCRSCKLSEDDD